MLVHFDVLVKYHKNLDSIQGNLVERNKQVFSSVHDVPCILLE